jgi:hypothetical protein
LDGLPFHSPYIFDHIEAYHNNLFIGHNEAKSSIGALTVFSELLKRIKASAFQ